jgi:transposase-like protein
MEELNQAKLWLEHCALQKNLPELRKLRKFLQDTLKQVDHSLEQQDPKAPDPHKRCPQCQSSHVRKHGTTPVARIYCLDCNRAYVVNRQPLYYRRRHHNTILDLIVEIHTTNKSATEIVAHLGISSKTYYVWRKEILSIFPQLEHKFKNRRKK